MREITAEQYAALEQVHGKDMVVLLTVGEDDVAFRRPTELDVDILLEAKGRGEHSYLEECAAGCLLSPEAPRAGVSVEANQRLPEAEQGALVTEKQRLRALWKSAPLLRDSVPMAWAELCGWGMSYEAKPLGGGRYRITARPNAHSAMDSEALVELTARVFSPHEYSEWRKKSQTEPEGHAERYAWRTLVEGPAGDGRSREEIARVHPFLPLGLGQATLPALGSEGRAVRPKKFGAGQAPQPGSTTSTPPQAT